MLADADNSFNGLNQYLMLWNVFFLWQKGSRFSSNRYHHQNIVIICTMSRGGQRSSCSARRG
ncbi:hypothetical protein ACHAWF_004865 [Thalassiosira exigua]